MTWTLPRQVLRLTFKSKWVGETDWTLPDLLHICWIVNKLAVQGALVLSSELVPEQLQLILYMPQVLTT